MRAQFRVTFCQEREQVRLQRETGRWFTGHCRALTSGWKPRVLPPPGIKELLQRAGLLSLLLGYPLA